MKISDIKNKIAVRAGDQADQLASAVKAHFVNVGAQPGDHFDARAFWIERGPIQMEDNGEIDLLETALLRLTESGFCKKLEDGHFTITSQGCKELNR